MGIGPHSSLLKLNKEVYNLCIGIPHLRCRFAIYAADTGPVNQSTIVTTITQQHAIMKNTTNKYKFSTTAAAKQAEKVPRNIPGSKAFLQIAVSDGGEKPT